MKRIHILTNTDERCGNAQYARDLEEQLRDHYFVTIGPQFQPSECVLVNWHSAVVPFSVENVHKLHELGIKVVIIHQNSTGVGEAELFRVADAVIAHEPMISSIQIDYIPHPVLVVEPLDFPTFDFYPRIGTAGFPFSWKRMDVAAEAAKRVAAEFLAIAPKYPGVDTRGEIKKLWIKNAPRTAIYENWIPAPDVVRMLSTCTVNVFWFQSESVYDEIGQTGSARLAVAAKKPIIISRHRKFRTMIEEYSDELYIADTEEDVYGMAKEIMVESWQIQAKHAHLKLPIRQFTETNWQVAGEKYRQIIERVTA